MHRRPRSGLAAALLAGALALGSPAVAFADGPAATPAPATTAPAASDADAAAYAEQVKRLAAEIVALQRTAERAGEKAQKAGEKANDAQAESDAAAERLVQAQDAAEAAAETARASRARASAVAARLARTDFGTLPLDLMLNARTATGVLGGLSTTGQLTVQAKKLYDQAELDRQEAVRLQGVAETEAQAAAAAADKAEKAFTKAKKAAATAKKAVEAALAEQRDLLASAPVQGDVCATAGTTPVSTCLPVEDVTPAGSSVGDRVVAFAMSQIGKPYVFAAAGPNAYDCSGLTLTAYAKAGVSIGIHSATAQYRTAASRGDLVPLRDAKPGDLLFYTDGGGDMYHVTIYAGNGLMIEAPYPGATVREAPVRTGDLVGQVAHLG